MPRSPTDTIRFLTLDELGRLLAATRGSVRDRALFLLAYRHGLRASEVGRLHAEDLDLRTLRLMVHRLKGSHSGAHPLQPDEAKAIRAWLRERPQPPSPVLFPSSRFWAVPPTGAQTNQAIAAPQASAPVTIMGSRTLDALSADPHAVGNGGW